MSPAPFRSLMLTLSLCLGVYTTAGCQPPPPLSETQRSLNTVTLAQKSLATANADVGNTLTSLDKFCNKPSYSSFEQFVKYSRAVKQHGRDLQNIAAVMSDQGNTFFLQWDREIAAMTDKRLQAHAREQRESVNKSFQQIDVQGPVLRDAYQSYVSDLNNLQTFFDYDKSAQGIAAAGPLVEKFREHGGDLQHQLDIQIANVARVKDIFLAMQSR